MKEVSTFVAIPSFNVKGDAYEGGIEDGIAEKFDIDPSGINVIERNGDFYVLSKDLEFNFHEVNSVVSNSVDLDRAYHLSIRSIAKQVRRADKLQNHVAELKNIISMLKEKNRINEERYLVEKEKKLRIIEAANAVEYDFLDYIKRSEDI